MTLSVRFSFSSFKRFLSMWSPSRYFVSPWSAIRTFCIICRTITSICLSLIFTPCMRYTSWISFTRYSCTAVVPLIRKMSCGSIEPADKRSPARIKSPSWTKRCLPNGTRYVRLSLPSGLSINTSREPRFGWPIDIVPSISPTTAGSLGCRASKSSVTRGKPPVISRVLPMSRGIFTKIAPAWITSPSSTFKCARVGIGYDETLCPFLLTIAIPGIRLFSRLSMITFWMCPVCSSGSSR